MKKQAKARKLQLTRETLTTITELQAVQGAGSQNRACATYTEIIGPCVPTQNWQC